MPQELVICVWDYSNLVNAILPIFKILCGFFEKLVVLDPYSISLRETVGTLKHQEICVVSINVLDCNNETEYFWGQYVK